MKKYTILVLSLLLVFGMADARPRKKKTGQVKDQVYIDADFNFSMKLSEDWKYFVRNEGDNFRLSLVKKNYEVPPDYIDSPEYTMVPRLAVWVDTTSWTPFEFVDSVLSDSYSSSQKDELRKEFEILIYDYSTKGSTREHLIPRQKKPLNIDGKKAMSWVGKLGYRKEITKSASSQGGIRVSGDYGGYIVAIKKDNYICVMHMICEWNYFETNMAEVQAMIETFKW